MDGLLLRMNGEKEQKGKKKGIPVTPTQIVINLGNTAVFNLKLSNLLHAFTEVVKKKKGKCYRWRRGWACTARLLALSFINSSSLHCMSMGSCFVIYVRPIKS